jgi:prevent-host-death family protein
MTQVNVHEAKTHLSQLLKRVQRGERITIARSGHPIAVLGPIEGTSVKRPIGMDRGRVVIHPDFDAPIPEFDPEYAHPEDPLNRLPE